MSASFVAAVETLVLIAILRHRHGHFGGRAILQGVGYMTLAAAIMAPVLYITISRLLPLYAADKGFSVLAPKFSVIVLVGLAAYLIPCYLLRLKEASDLVARVKELMVRSLNLT
jgi:hypothetical protein